MNKKTLIIIAAIVILLIGGGVMVFAAKNRNTPAEVNNDDTQQQTIGTLSPKDIGLELKMSSNNHKVKVVVNKASDIKSLEYDITYNADIPKSELADGEEGGQVQRGFNDEAKLKAGQSKYESKDFDLGSCSRNVCRYDTGVTGVDIVMKVTKRDGKVYSVKDSVSF